MLSFKIHSDNINVMGIVIIKPANGAISAGKFSQDTNTYNKTVCKLTFDNLRNWKTNEFSSK